MTHHVIGPQNPAAGHPESTGRAIDVANQLARTLNRESHADPEIVALAVGCFTRTALIALHAADPALALRLEAFLITAIRNLAIGDVHPEPVN